MKQLCPKFTELEILTNFLKLKEKFKKFKFNSVWRWSVLK